MPNKQASHIQIPSCVVRLFSLLLFQVWEVGALSRAATKAATTPLVSFGSALRGLMPILRVVSLIQRCWDIVHSMVSTLGFLWVVFFFFLSKTNSKNPSSAIPLYLLFLTSIKTISSWWSFGDHLKPHTLLQLQCVVSTQAHLEQCLESSNKSQQHGSHQQAC